MAFSHTFVVPSHNQGKYLPATIEALLAQEEPSEIIISEDFSSDDSPQIAASYAAKHPDRIRLTKPPEHRGMFPNWNHGVGLVRTEWASIMGADDVALPFFSRTIREGTEKSANAVIVCADWDFVDGDDKLLFSEKVLSLPTVSKPPQGFYQLIIANKIHPAAHAFRLDAWRKVGGFPEKFRFYGDWGFFLSIAPLGDVVHMARTISRYRVAYRPGIIGQRMLECFADEVYMQTEHIPAIGREIPNLRTDKLQAAARRRLRHTLHDHIREAPDADHASAAKIVAPWARSLGPESVALVERFARGEDVPLEWFEAWVRQPARRIYKALRR
jgi:glycosyltransferase involved in cell wall biosynthesis